MSGEIELGSNMAWHFEHVQRRAGGGERPQVNQIPTVCDRLASADNRERPQCCRCRRVDHGENVESGLAGNNVDDDRAFRHFQFCDSLDGKGEAVNG